MNCHHGSLSLVGAATSVIYVMTNVLSQQTCVCHDKHMLVVTKVLCLSQVFCSDKSMLVATFYHDMCLSWQIFVETNTVLSRQKVLSWQAYFWHDKIRVLLWQTRLLWQKLYLWQLPPMKDYRAPMSEYFSVGPWDSLLQLWGSLGNIKGSCLMWDSSCTLLYCFAHPTLQFSVWFCQTRLLLAAHFQEWWLLMTVIGSSQACS